MVHNNKEAGYTIFKVLTKQKIIARNRENFRRHFGRLNEILNRAIIRHLQKNAHTLNRKWSVVSLGLDRQVLSKRECGVPHDLQRLTHIIRVMSSDVLKSVG